MKNAQSHGFEGPSFSNGPSGEKQCSVVQIVLFYNSSKLLIHNLINQAEDEWNLGDTMKRSAAEGGLCTDMLLETPKLDFWPIWLDNDPEWHGSELSLKFLSVGTGAQDFDEPLATKRNKHNPQIWCGLCDAVTCKRALSNRCCGCQSVVISIISDLEHTPTLS